MAVFAVVMAGSGFSYWQYQQQYELTPVARTLAGETAPALADKLGFDEEKALYRFNQPVDESEQPATESVKGQVGTAGDALYSLDIPADPSRGITYRDGNTDLKFDMVPKFDMLAGRLKDDRLIFPLEQGAQAIYTVKSNGLKEDIIFERAPKDGKAEFRYELKLPETLEARMMDDGAVGIYSADPLLFSKTMSFGGDEDKAKIESARASAPKDHLMFALPAPVITVTSGDKNAQVNQAETATATFQLDGNELILRAEKLDTIDTTFSIDPSVVITSSSDFINGNDEGGIDFTTDAIQRGGLSGGTVGSWTTDSDTVFPNDGLLQFASASYGGYAYAIGGLGDRGGTLTYEDAVYYAQMNSDGTAGTWQATTPLPVAKDFQTATAYNGYLYVAGGRTSDDVYYAKINTNGTVGAWQTGPLLPDVRDAASSLAYNGYLYVIGGRTDSVATYFNTVLYAKINGDGSIGAWQTTTPFPTARASLGAVAYNGQLYVIGGQRYDGTQFFYHQNVHKATFNDDGTIGAWQEDTDSMLGDFRTSFTSVVRDGYIYVVGGNNTTIGITPSVKYAPIHADGTLGRWQESAALSVGRSYAGIASYGDYIYTYGGNAVSSDFRNDMESAKIQPAGSTGGYGAITALPQVTQRASVATHGGYVYVTGGDDGATIHTDVEYAKINADGTLGAWQAGPDIPNSGRYWHGSEVYNGYLYIMGGALGSTPQNTVYYAKINADGSLDAWATTTAMPEALSRLGTAVFNGRLYVAGGDQGGTANIDVYYATLNADGSIASWLPTTDLPAAIDYMSMEQANGYLYVTGGFSGAYRSTVYYAEINDADGTVGTWQTAPNLPASPIGHSTIAHNGYLYVAGGTNGTNTLDSVYKAKMNEDGSLDAWTTTTPLSSARRYHAGVVAQGNLYIIGGNGTAVVADATYASINNGGSGQTGAWQSATDLPAALYDHATASDGTYAYTTGGNNGTTRQSTVYSTLLPKSGALGSWQTTTALPEGLEGHTTVTHNGFLYVLGGNNGSRVSTVRYAAINGDGTIGSWQTTTSLPAAVDQHSSVVHNGYVYVLGGFGSGGNERSTVYRAPLNADGSVGTWQASSSLARVIANHASVVSNGHIYVMGGSDNGTATNDVFSAEILSGGSLGAWQPATDLPRALSEHAASVRNGYVYVSGGETPDGATAKVNYAPLLSGGGIGNWQAATGLPSPRYGQTSFIANGNSYTLGGAVTSGGSTVTFSDGFEDTTIAPFTTTGGTPWTTVSDSSNSGTYSATKGGFTPADLMLTQTLSSSGTITFARRLNAPGFFGSFSSVSFYIDNNLQQQWNSTQPWESFTYNVPAGTHTFKWEYLGEGGDGKAWVDDVEIAEGSGASTATAVDDVLRAPLEVIPRVGHYSKLLDLGGSALLTNIGYQGDLPGGLADISYRAAGSDGIFGSTQPASSITGGGAASNCVAGTGDGIQYIMLSTRFDDSGDAVFPDSLATPSSIQELTVDYGFGIAPSELRLRGGKYFSNGELQPLDTCS